MFGLKVISEHLFAYLFLSFLKHQGKDFPEALLKNPHVFEN